jgi:hypothetical protein
MDRTQNRLLNFNSTYCVREVFLVSLVMRRLLQRVPIGIIVLIIDFLILEKVFFVGAFVLLIVLQIEKTRLKLLQKNPILNP